MPVYRFTEQKIRHLSDPAGFARGREYYAAGAVHGGVILGDEIRARCRGSGFMSYEVAVRCGPRGIVDYSCTCPRGGFCQHVVAVCLARIYDPGSFRDLDDPARELAGLNRNELIGLIGRFLKEEPGLVAFVELAVAASGAVDEKTWRQPARAALAHQDGELIERDLTRIMDTARQLVESGNLIGAGTVSYGLLTVLTEECQRIMRREDGDEVAYFTSECALMLERCLREGNPDPQRRAAWLGALVAAEVAWAEAGMEMHPGPGQVAATQATADEWISLEERIRAALTSNKESRRILSQVLAIRAEKEGGAAAGAAVLRETGTPEQVMFVLAGEGRVAEALALAGRCCAGRPRLVLRLADQLTARGYGEQAAGFVAGLAGRKDAFLRWLCRYHLEREEWGRALEWQERRFLLNPGMSAYLETRETAVRAGVWPEVRSRLSAVLEEKQAWRDLLEIALAEGDIPRALDLYAGHPREIGLGVREELARAAEQDFPAEAASFYREMIDAWAATGQRWGYREAARYLVRVRELMTRAGQVASWEQYLTGLKGEYRRHWALQAELRQVGL